MKDKNRRCASCLSNVKEEFSLKNLTLDYDAPVDFVKLQVMNLSNYLVVFKTPGKVNALILVSIQIGYTLISCLSFTTHMYIYIYRKLEKKPSS